VSNFVSARRALLAAAGLAYCGLAPSVAYSEPPDFTGVWTNYRGGAGAARRARPELPLTAEGRRKADRYIQVTTGTNYTPGGYCVGGGMPGSMLGSGGYPMEIIQRPEQITVIYEAHNEVRRIYFGDRAPDPATMWPERNGLSVGRWEGDTLVVETSHLVEQVDTAYPHSAEASIVEEYRLSDEDGTRVLTATMTMTDPLFLTEPFKTEKKWQAVPNGHVRTYECSEPEWLDLLDELMGEADEGSITESRGR
jgi:hypothetical protein